MNGREINNMAKAHHLHSEVNLGKVKPDTNLEKDIWWVWLIKGIALIAFGGLAVFWPSITLYALAYIFSVYIVVTGVADVILGFRSLGHSRSWFLRSVWGIVQIGLGVYIINHGQTILIASFILLLGLALVFQGIVEIASYFKSSTDVGARGWLIFGGILSLVAGIVVLRQPVLSGLAFVWILGFYGILGGANCIAIALGSRNSKKLTV